MSKAPCYLGFHGGWNVNQFNRQNGWKEIIRSLDLTQKQKKAVTLILEFVQKDGKLDPAKVLVEADTTTKPVMAKFVSARQLIKYMHEVATHKHEPSYRYLHYALAWLLQNGWLDEGKMKCFSSGSLRVFWFSERVLDFVKQLETSIPTLWMEQK